MCIRDSCGSVRGCSRGAPHHRCLRRRQVLCMGRLRLECERESVDPTVAAWGHGQPDHGAAAFQRILRSAYADLDPDCTLELRLSNSRADHGLHLSLIHISEPTRLLSISYAVFCLKKKKIITLYEDNVYS
eukprot:TRINITY_DN64754_c0_g1_i1.p1 TRINITY_DN64754_c0_g1~~TRINITY_DN64754_c0_g1_i1.p1  ORF type:complete len:131 (+),score=10.92 TRINITY_DN64754_c0_g1_i1:145-537(+)